MRLKKHLNEELKSPYEIVEILQEDCKPWLKEIEQADDFLWRTIGGVLVRDIQKYTTRQDRLPRDTNIDVHNFIDDLHRKNHGFRARSRAVFCWNIHPKQNSPNMMFPIGKFRYVYPKDKQFADIFNWLSKLFRTTDDEQLKASREGKSIGDAWPKGTWGEHITPLRKKSIEMATKNGYSTKGIKKILGQHPMREVMVDCKEYYLVNSTY